VHHRSHHVPEGLVVEKCLVPFQPVLLVHLPALLQKFLLLAIVRALRLTAACMLTCAALLAMCGQTLRRTRRFYSFRFDPAVEERLLRAALHLGCRLIICVLAAQTADLLLHPSDALFCVLSSLLRLRVHPPSESPYHRARIQSTG
jgi:hypothetical protein